MTLNSTQSSKTRTTNQGYSSRFNRQYGHSTSRTHSLLSVCHTVTRNSEDAEAPLKGLQWENDLHWHSRVIHHNCCYYI